ncbi:BCAM0308 family protein [Nitrosococcus oceani]|uniref:ATPase n=2 Tax=Nitrosococcus oceani TaxID=1229 RepID=Q3JAA1_NITOC|nr:BCAM0308 family protein [Nitrosococcus oceani]KFI19359.1 hypothetical protein IB75_09425 [Nitrosococcus oceani C-27]ABA58245.1 conserved hypothetical protein [Nitrosococcus oceani ATCC 19707]EDZ68360.1 hypothetical protein NOC27_1687 [Nitrosococcus oceani AFC27]KFI22606.1 hypothetical protein HW44_08605 [Nitrosococcus oceani]GEM20465.1 hypothetical protein NONS58_18830 [Nitrosococcus oceani]
MGKRDSSKITRNIIAHEKGTPGPGGNRGDRLIKESIHDPYKTRKKLPEPTFCPVCRAVFERGRWSWAELPADANQKLCPACQRMRDRVPAGFLTLSGEFFQEHREEIINLIRNKEESEKAQHPLKRIMDIEEKGKEMVVTFTEIHLPRGIGEALSRAYEGNLDYQYTDGNSILRVRWHR